MALTSGQVNPDDYPAGMRALFARTSRRTLWDGGATTFDQAKTTWDAGRLGARITRRNKPRTERYTATPVPATTWDGLLTQWDDYTTLWDVRSATLTAADKWTAHIAKHRQYSTAYNTLRLWKQVRWNLCGLARGITGRNLYLRSAFEQNTAVGYHPISPCARRVIDPGASPFDWTP